MTSPYSPPYALTPGILDLVAGIAETAGRLGALEGEGNRPKLRRENRLRSIQASLAIENNSLSLEQVTAVIAGKRVLGPPREIQEVRNAFAAYEAMPSWHPATAKDLLAAHRLLIQGLADDAGKFRRGSVGIAQGGRVIHLAPPADRVPGLMKDLLAWLRRGEVHPLVASCVFHYELEFIHPFTDGNGRMGRLWQTLVLSRWNPLFAWLPVETVIRDQQAEYYQILATCDKAGNSTAFIAFLLAALLKALQEIGSTDQVADQVTDQVGNLLRTLAKDTLPALECMKRLGLSHRPTFRANYLNPAIAAELVEMTIPEKPNSRLQRYRLTPQGRLSIL
ncbi:MAG: Fic family protein [Luteolibacter sp.]|uniref:Fic family protein n=1 Tax=Luteolibacter sp. TaxID=1962973 RepID=UPI0032649CB1